MQLIVNHAYVRRLPLRRTLAHAARRAWMVLKAIWSVTFPAQPPDGPGGPNENMAALRAGARLSENVDAVARRHVA
jgi:hypothetical protein